MKRKPIKVRLGFNPSPDNTELNTFYYTDGDKVRFYEGSWQTVGGCLNVSLGGDSISGYCRWGYNLRVSDTAIYSVLGTHTKLYSLLGNDLVNITPLETSTTAIANSLATNYATMGADPIATTNGSKTVTVTWTSHKLQTGDYVTISGAATTNGIPNTELNAVHFVQSTPTANTFTLTVPTTAATSTGSGGGASVVVATDLITVTHASHGFATGDRIKLAGAADTGGIVAASINKEHIIRVNTSSTYTVSCSQDYASSSVSGGGGASTTVQGEIADGQADQSYGYGYGMGLYGVGRYGVGKTGYYPVLPRIWSGGEFGNYLILTPGTTGSGVGAKVYQWAGSNTTAPTVVTNAPTDVNFVTVFKNIVFALAGNVCKWSDQGDQTVWSAAATNQAGTQTLYGVGRLISAMPLDSEMLIFSKATVHRCTYIGRPYVFSFDKLEVIDGIIGVHAAAAYGGEIYWQGNDNFYVYRGGSVTPLVINNTIREFVYNRLNASQSSKVIAWANSKYSEIWWFYPANSETENDSYVIYNLVNQTWAYGTWDRSAVIHNDILDYPRLVSSSSAVYDHERGDNNDTVGLDWFIETNYAQIGNGDETFEILGLIPDGVQAENAQVTVYTKLSPQSTVERTFGAYTISASSSSEIYKIDFRAHGAMRKYKFEDTGDLNSSMRMGAYHEIIQKGDSR